MVVLHGLAKLIGDHAGVLARVFLLGIQDLQPMGACLGGGGSGSPPGIHLGSLPLTQPDDASPAPCLPPLHPEGITWEQLDVVQALKRGPILHPGDGGGGKGQRLADQGDGVVDGHGHLLVSTVLAHSQDGGNHCGGAGSVLVNGDPPPWAQGPRKASDPGA